MKNIALKLNKYLLFSCLFLVSLSESIGQSGINVYAGLSSAETNNTTLTPENTAHTGYLIGADARVFDSNMYFIVGAQLHNIEFLAAEERSTFSVDNSMSWLKLRFGLGFTLFHIGDRTTIRTKGIGSINIISSTPDDLSNAPFTNYNSAVAGVTVGLGADIGKFTVDLDYERGFFNAVNMVEDTEFDFLTFTVGFLF